ncbi:SUF system Fe-S cluster assembly regulator [Myxococcota bacterium]|nr:SUF system Fe-S cluster assembly regulator [Myxococcota bacterium]
MIRISKLTDYGIVLLTLFARDVPGRVHNARDLSEASHIPLPTVGKLLKLLNKGGLLLAHRGAKGGYSLSRRSDDISVADIIEVLEGPIGLTECGTPEPSPCGLQTRCPVRGHWQLINDVVLHALRALSLADMSRPAEGSCGSKPASDLIPASALGSRPNKPAL